jgi:hypothetical protein
VLVQGKPRVGVSVCACVSGVCVGVGCVCYWVVFVCAIGVYVVIVYVPYQCVCVVDTKLKKWE